MKGIVIIHTKIADSFEEGENRCGRSVPTREALVRFALPLSLVRIVLLRRYSPVVNPLPDRSFPSCMRPTGSRR